MATCPRGESAVKAVIVTSIHTLQVYLGDELVEVFAYQLPSLNE